MKTFKNGVSFYTTGIVTVPFPETDVVCAWCPLMTSDVTKRERCSITGEILFAPKDLVGNFCPIKFEKENNNDHDGIVE